MSNSMIRKGRQRRLSAAVASLAVAGLVLTACGSSDGGDTASDAGDPAESGETSQEEAGGMDDMCGDDVIRIGTSLPLTGRFSQPGQEAQRGYNAWVELTNRNGGLLGRPVELVVLDDASSQEQVVTDYNNLISQQKVPLLLGTFSSLLNFPASTVAENNQMVLIAPAGGSPTIYEPEPKFYFFAQQAIAPDQANPFVDMLLSLPEDERPKTAAFVSIDDPFALPVIESMQAQLEEAGIETVYSGIYPEGTTNLQPQAASIAAAEPDLIAQGSVFEDGISLSKSLVQIGYNPDFMFQTTAPAFGAQYIDAVGQGNEDGIFFAVSWSEKAPTPGNEEFVAEYQAQNGEGLVPTEDSANGFVAAEVLQAAVEATGGCDNLAMADWLRANTVETILGPLSWDEIGRPQGDFLLAQWQNGTVEIVAPEVATTNGGQVVIPKPDWQ
jgi:branched-chain amino acid transport system substrate-binding protein